MLGKPKFSFGDKVKFTINNEEKIGSIYIIDNYGTFEDDSDVSYDILNEDETCLYKHINEKYVELIEVPEKCHSSVMIKKSAIPHTLLVYVLETHKKGQGMIKHQTFIGREDDDVFSMALEALVRAYTEVTGETIQTEHYERLKSLYNANKPIIIKGYTFNIWCLGNPEVSEY